MTREEFIDIVMADTGLPEQDAERIAHAVLLTLRSQLSHDEVLDIRETLPEDIEDLWEGGWLQRLMVGLQSLRYMNMEDFIEQVREASDVRSFDDAEHYAKAVLSALKEAIPDREVDHLSQDLPEELQDFWKAA